MIARKRTVVNEASPSQEVAKAKETLKRKGWSYRTAAPELGVCYQHIAHVLTQRRDSKRLLAAIEALPYRKEVA